MVAAANTSAPLGAQYAVVSANPGLPSASTTGDRPRTEIGPGVGSEDLRSYSHPTRNGTASPLRKPVPASKKLDSAFTTQDCGNKSQLSYIAPTSSSSGRENGGSRNRPVA